MLLAYDRSKKSKVESNYKEVILELLEIEKEIKVNHQRSNNRYCIYLKKLNT